MIGVDRAASRRAAAQGPPHGAAATPDGADDGEEQVGVPWRLLLPPIGAFLFAAAWALTRRLSLSEAPAALDSIVRWIGLLALPAAAVIIGAHRAMSQRRDLLGGLAQEAREVTLAATSLSSAAALIYLLMPVDGASPRWSAPLGAALGASAILAVASLLTRALARRAPR